MPISVSAPSSSPRRNTSIWVQRCQQQKEQLTTTASRMTTWRWQILFMRMLSQLTIVLRMDSMAATTMRLARTIVDWPSGARCQRMTVRSLPSITMPSTCSLTRIIVEILLQAMQPTVRVRSTNMILLQVHSKLLRLILPATR